MLGLPVYTLDDFLASKRKGFYRVETLAGRTILTVHRTGQLEEFILCLSPGHANQVRQSLTDEGLCGLIEGAL